MVQEAKRDAEMEKVYGVFEGYIKASPYIEWLWSKTWIYPDADRGERAGGCGKQSSNGCRRFLQDFVS